MNNLFTRVFLFTFLVTSASMAKVEVRGKIHLPEKTGALTKASLFYGNGGELKVAAFTSDCRMFKVWNLKNQKEEMSLPMEEVDGCHVFGVTESAKGEVYALLWLKKPGDSTHAFLFNASQKKYVSLGKKRLLDRVYFSFFSDPSAKNLALVITTSPGEKYWWLAAFNFDTGQIEKEVPIAGEVKELVEKKMPNGDILLGAAGRNFIALFNYSRQKWIFEKKDEGADFFSFGFHRALPVPQRVGSKRTIYEVESFWKGELKEIVPGPGDSGAADTETNLFFPSFTSSGVDFYSLAQKKVIAHFASEQASDLKMIFDRVSNKYFASISEKEGLAFFNVTENKLVRRFSLPELKRNFSVEKKIDVWDHLGKNNRGEVLLYLVGPNITRTFDSQGKTIYSLKTRSRPIRNSVAGVGNQFTFNHDYFFSLWNGYSDPEENSFYLRKEFRAMERWEHKVYKNGEEFLLTIYGKNIDVQGFMVMGFTE